MYDLDAGLARLLDVLADDAINATFRWVGLAAQEHPDPVRACFEAGHEIAAHGWDHRTSDRMTREQQREDLLRSRDVLADITGTLPVGHKSPFWQSTPDTVGLLQELGLRWNMDRAFGDVPVAMRPDPHREPVIQLPPSRWWDDYTFFVEHALPPRLVAEFWREDWEVLRAEGKLMCLTLHPWICGRPGPSRALTQFLDFVIALGDGWIARADHVARWWRERERDLAMKEP
ncbi:MAG: polysaccharide deacetylase family protein [Thermomicrobium sp.]|nr:polysaccharide deacetylase family protein [Thermomicrobium sp.]MDW7982308.1 polysaccharide deacetylase family protein [Thermomicrobium sp.]